MGDFDRERLRAAFQVVFGDSRSPEPASPVGDDLVAQVALDLAGELVPDAEAVTDGASAVVSGLLVSLELQPVASIADTLPTAVDAVRRLGRHTVIARHCDLDGVAELEQAISAGFGVRWARRPDLLASFVQLFEIGLALGLAASGDADQA